MLKDLELAGIIFDLLRPPSSKIHEFESDGPGIVRIRWVELGDGRVAIEEELYHHFGDSPKDYDAPWRHVTIYATTPKRIKNTIQHILKYHPWKS